MPKTPRKHISQPRSLTGLAITGVVIAGLGVAGCGSSGTSSSSSTAPASTPAITKAEFLTKANAICAKGDQKIQAAQQAFGKKQPSLKQIAASEVPNIQAEIDGIRALGTPSGDAAKVATMIATAQTDLNKVKGDPSLLTRKTSAFVGFANVAHPYGLTACAPTA